MNRRHAFRLAVAALVIVLALDNYRLRQDWKWYAEELNRFELLVEAYRAGVLEDARLTLTIAEKAYERGGANILDLLDAARTSRAIQQNYIETLFNYQRNVFLLESAVGREIP
jgi:hypothetical protein